MNSWITKHNFHLFLPEHNNEGKQKKIKTIIITIADHFYTSQKFTYKEMKGIIRLEKHKTKPRAKWWWIIDGFTFTRNSFWIFIAPEKITCQPKWNSTLAVSKHKRKQAKIHKKIITVWFFALGFLKWRNKEINWQWKLFLSSYSRT